MITSHTYQTTATVAGRPAAITCEAKYDGKEWLILSPVAIDVETGEDVSDRIGYEADEAYQTAATAMLYGFHPELRKYDPYFGLSPA